MRFDDDDLKITALWTARKAGQPRIALVEPRQFQSPKIFDPPRRK